MNLDIHIEEAENQKNVFLSGEIDTYTAPKLRESLIPLTEQSGVEVIVDLSEVQYIDSTGLGIFVGVLKASDSNGSSLTLTGMSERIKRLFVITGLDEVINIVDRREEAK
ncbi:STAS domain-containing protein [Alkalicoccobacillus murimartini]|uniref:Anti-sigma factor antagonist n=1 Tax=Alkalicoccobacillus murimartini TaxID=171685 RepID=A0ABT9YL12_9BACI|nr:STAS domain-containing protein [Alkalicoccobacillus murimartini]MDQ0208567.1 anti-sigma B factor antagonist [Alkalicoccobacillus murimartini]